MEQAIPNTTMSIERSEEIKRLNSTADDIRASYIWIIFALGFPGNIFSIITILTMKSMTPATFYVAFLALCDGITLVIKLIIHQIYYHNVYLGTTGCKMEFLVSYTSSVGNWVLVLICAERFVSVCLPLKRNIIFTKRRCYITVTLLCVVLLILYTSMFWTMRDAMPGGKSCGTLDEFYVFWTTGWYWINVCINLLVPLPIIIVFTVLIIRGLKKSRRDRRSILQNGSGSEESNKRLLKESERLESTISLMLTLAAIVFAIVCTPSVVHLLAYEPSDDELIEARWRLFDQIQFLCFDSSHAINFFLYFLTAKKFREQFFYLLTCRRWRKGVAKTKAYEVTHSTYTTKYTIAKSNEDVSHI